MEAANELESHQDAILRMLEEIEYQKPKDQQESQHLIHTLEGLVSSLFKDRSRLAAEKVLKAGELNQLRRDLDLRSAAYFQEKEQLTSELAAVKLSAEKSKKEDCDYSTFLESEVESSKVVVFFLFSLSFAPDLI
jgi:hypothetical protein